MATTYTFPQLTLKSGTFDITIKTSRGSGTIAVSEKYFTEVAPLVKETEVYGGSLRHDSMRFGIGFDLDNYFRDTIFASFADSDGYVDILVQRNGNYEFYGTIDPTTTSFKKFYSDNSVYESLSFDAHWIVKRLEKVKVETLEALFSSADCVAAEYLGNGDIRLDYAYLFTLQYLFDKFALALKNETGLTNVTISISLGTAYGAISKDAYLSNGVGKGYDTLPKSDDKYAYGAEFVGKYDYVDINNWLLFWTYADGSKLGSLWDSSDDKTDQSFYNFDNVYEVLTSIIKSFGFILKTELVNSTELSLLVVDRIDGNDINGDLTDLMDSEKSLLTSEYLEAITVSPKANNTNQPIYDYKIKENFGSSFSYNTALKTEYIESYDRKFYRNLIYSFQGIGGDTNIAETCFGLRDILEGNRLNEYFDFNDDNGLTGWTTGTTVGASISAVTSATDNHTPADRESGCAEIALPSDSSSAYLQCDVGSVDHEIMIIFWVKLPSFSTGFNSFTSIDFRVDTYDDTPTLLVPENSISEYTNKSITNSNGSSIGVTNWRMFTFRVRPKKGDVIKYVKLTVSAQFPTASVTVRIDDISIYRSHQYFHQMLGRKLQRYYSRPNGKLRNKYNGILPVNCGDRLTENGETFYIKRVAKDYQNNETEIEAINYQ